LYAKKETAMPRFYIHFRTGDQIARDDVGVELSSLEEARQTALLSAAREIVADNVKSNAKNPLQAVIIAGENGQDLLTVSVKDVLPEPIRDEHGEPRQNQAG
jgi:hypothetical protein